MRTHRNRVADHTEMLAAMKVCREAMVKMLVAYNPRHPIYREANWLMTDIDNLAGIVTGDRELFRLKGHGR